MQANPTNFAPFEILQRAETFSITIPVGIPIDGSTLCNIVASVGKTQTCGAIHVGGCNLPNTRTFVATIQICGAIHVGGSNFA